MDELDKLRDGLHRRGLNPSEMLFDENGFTKMKVDSYNKTIGNMTGFECKKCLNRGNYMGVRADGSTYFRDCGCLVTRRCIANMEKSGLKNSIRDMIFEKFVVSEDFQKKALNTAKCYSETVEGWLLLCGQPGSGKTHLCTAVVHDLLLEGLEVVYVPWVEESARIKAMDSERREDYIKELQRVEVLYLDDLFKVGQSQDGSARPTPADIALAYKILNPRCTNSLPTLISTERSLAELVNIDEALGSRIAEMSRDHNVQIAKKPGRNYRLRGLCEV